MKPYIDFNAQKKKEGTNDADQNLFKLLNNAVYDKAMENLRKRTKLRIAKNENDIVKHKSKPSYVSDKILQKVLVPIDEEKIVCKNCILCNENPYERFMSIRNILI